MKKTNGGGAVDCTLKFSWGKRSRNGSHEDDGKEEKTFSAASEKHALEAAREIIKLRVLELLIIRTESKHITYAALTVKERKSSKEASLFFLDPAYSNFGSIKFSGKLLRANGNRCWQ